MSALDRFDAARLPQVRPQDEAQQVRPPLGIHRWHELIRLINNDSLHAVSVGQALPDGSGNCSNSQSSQPANSCRAAIAYPPPSLSAQGSAGSPAKQVDNIGGHE